MRYLRNEHTDPFYNMAFDEYALQQLSLDEPLFVLWQNRPSVIIGLNQNAYAEVDLNYLKANHISLVRRVTGGGAVYHDLGNLNYTIVGRTADLNRDYPEYTSYILHALQALGVKAELSGRNDILVNGCKVSGYAKRVYKDRLMVHGTLMYDVNLEVLEKALTPPMEKIAAKGIASVRSRVTNLREHLPEVTDITDLRMRLERQLSCDYRDAEYCLDEEQLQTIARMANEKFITEEWTFQKSTTYREPSTSHEKLISRKRRLPCGTVEATVLVRRDTIEHCHFRGDFIGSLSPAALEEALIGICYKPSDVRQCLSAMDVELYFDKTQADELLSLIIF